MAKSKRKGWVYLLILFIILLASDLASKYYVNAILPNVGDTKVIIPDILTFIYSKNYGASFGIFSGMRWFLLSISIATAIGIFLFLVLYKTKDRMLRIVLVMILAGAIGNIYDRLIYGYVRDFIDYTLLNTYFNIDFAICNVADIYLTVGAFLLIIYVLFVYKEPPKKYKPNKKKKGVKQEEEEGINLDDVISINGDGSSSFVDYDGGVSQVQEQIPKGIVKKENRSRDIEITDEVVFEEEEKQDKKAKPIKSKLKVTDDVEFNPEEEVKSSKKQVKEKSKLNVDVVEDPSFSDYDKN